MDWFMIFHNRSLAILLSISFFFFFTTSNSQSDSPLVPAIITFGDSILDVGNNNYLTTFFKADFPPYGRDFLSHSPTGRFSNGKLAVDITAEVLGFDTLPLPYLSPLAAGENLLTGVSFASAGSGYYDKTAFLYNVIPLSKQLKYYKEYISKLRELSNNNSSIIISEALHLLSAGSSDFVQNYYINPLLNLLYTPDQFSDILLQIFSTFIKEVYVLGGRRIGVTSLPPLGCLPASITLFGLGNKGCVSRINNDAQVFNKKLNVAAGKLRTQLHGLKIVVFDIYKPLHDLIINPSNYGFAESGKGCCGTGKIETSILCNPISVGTCENATKYVFWDSVHPSEAANQLLADSLLFEGISLIS